MQRSIHDMPWRTPHETKATKAARIDRGVIRLTNVPTANDRAGIFSSPITDPTTGRPFLNNTLPQGRIDPVAAAITGLPNVVGDPSGPKTVDQWFNIAAFAAPAQFTFGNAGTGILVGPGYFNLDLGIHRNFPIRERLTLSYRAELFNSFNRANFGVPNSSIGNPQAGQISGTSAARIVQMALKLVF